MGAHPGEGDHGCMRGFGIFAFAAAILFSIGLHEFGHFITAKTFGMKVHRFFIGFGPKIWSITRGETEYGIKAIPLGGFVKIAGMDPFEEVPQEDLGRVFKAKKPWQRAIVLSAGSFTHFLLGFIILAAVLMTAGSGRPCTADRPTGCSEASRIIDNVEKGSPADLGGLRPGDEIRTVAGAPVAQWTDAVAAIRAHPGQTVEITLNRGGTDESKQVALASKRPDGSAGGYLGVGPEVLSIPAGPIAAITRAGSDVAVGAKESLVAFVNLFSPSSIGKMFSQLAGNTERTTADPATLIGVGGQAGALAGSGAWAGFFTLIAGFNIFIGVANLVPLPPLDGGHLAVLAYEKIRRRDVDMRKLIPVTATVVGVFGSLFFILLYLDIVQPLPSIG